MDSSVLVSVVQGWQLPAASTAVARQLADFVAWRIRTQRDTFAVPAVAFGEFLCGDGKTTPDDTKRLAEVIAKAFEIAPYDAQAAYECGKIFDKVGRKRHFQSIGNSPLKSWQSYKIDVLVLATAKSISADFVLADDSQMVSVGAEIGITVLRPDECKILPENQTKPKSIGGRQSLPGLGE